MQFNCSKLYTCKGEVRSHKEVQTNLVEDNNSRFNTTMQKLDVQYLKFFKSIITKC